jgi:hypothetical protein
MVVTIQTQFVKYTILAPSIIRAKYNEGIPIIPTYCAYGIIDGRLVIQKGEMYFLLMDLTTKVRATRGAMRILMGQSGTRGLLGIAILVNRKTEARVLKFLTMFFRFTIPVEVFYQDDSAMAYLVDLRDKRNDNLYEWTPQ